ncbi:MAG TPA: UDP-N-acetylmuramoyl-L-alanine--D-glutamate ligase [Dehalococcoidia bacterium]|nr:UDP-N-acetylmuramoyl-L-alanine--D-glutamate ligase [Dehalococcoidia bacterium]
MTVGDWRGKKVTVIGLGIEGEDMVRFFAARGATVTASDAKTREALGARVEALERLGARLALGRNDPADVAGADLVCVSQGVPLSNPAVQAARAAGTPVESMTSLFMRWWPGPIAGITGSSGKTTTTSLVDAIFTAAGVPHSLGGNIGVGLLSLLDSLPPGEGGRLPEGAGAAGQEGARRWAVLEISHSQLTLVRRSPDIAALLNVTPNHLDQFTWEEYVELKSRIFSFQGPDDTCVFNAEDPVSADLRRRCPSRQVLFGIEADHRGEGAFVSDGTLMLRRNGVIERLFPVESILLRGRHNVANVAAAAAFAAACGIESGPIVDAVRSFRAPPHRIEFVAEVDGVRYYNDSIATTPERTLAALRSFEEPVVLLLGGREKHLPLEELASVAAVRCRAIVCFGEARDILAAAVEGHGRPVERVGQLPEAVEAARRYARAGDVVLLSPACTSFDAYPNFERRGEHFRELVGALAAPGVRP